MKIIIIGGGVIGSACAYYLAKRDVACIVVEQEGVACAASGKAGGFLARNWCEANMCSKLAKFSYNLHMELLKEFTDVDYRCVNTYSALVNDNGSRKGISSPIPWLNGPVTKYAMLDSDENTAQVHPKKLCQRFLFEADRMTQGQTKVIIDKVIGIEFSDSDSHPIIKGVRLERGHTMDADVVVIAMGPWSHNAAIWFPKSCIPVISGRRAHSVVLKVPDNVKISPDCLFLEYSNLSGSISPEMYPRPDGTIYLCGLDDDKELPGLPAEVEVEKWRCDKLREVACVACSHFESAESLAEQACYLPMSPDNLPVIGVIGGVKGAYMAAGHSCWGILNSAGTGYAMAELISTGTCQSLDLTPFDPQRFMQNQNH